MELETPAVEHSLLVRDRIINDVETLYQTLCSRSGSSFLHMTTLLYDNRPHHVLWDKFPLSSIRAPRHNLDASALGEDLDSMQYLRYLRDCDDPDCIYSHGNNANGREKAIRFVFDRLEAEILQNLEETDVVYTAFGSGLLFSELVLITHFLMNHKDVKLRINLVDKAYDEWIKRISQDSKEPININSAGSLETPSLFDIREEYSNCFMGRKTISVQNQRLRFSEMKPELREIFNSIFLLLVHESIYVFCRYISEFGFSDRCSIYVYGSLEEYTQDPSAAANVMAAIDIEAENVVTLKEAASKCLKDDYSCMMIFSHTGDVYEIDKEEHLYVLQSVQSTKF